MPGQSRAKASTRFLASCGVVAESIPQRLPFPNVLKMRNDGFIPTNMNGVGATIAPLNPAAAVSGLEPTLPEYARPLTAQPSF